MTIKILKKSICLSVGLSVFSPVGLSSVLEEVMVTAQKREQNVQDVGIAISAFTGEQMDALGYDNAQQITAMSPGVTTIQPNGPSSYFTSIRGVGQNDFSGDHQESPVAVYVDEAYISAASGAGFQLFDMERAEVLRGPQGTLFGRNATGGLVHYLTEKPREERDGYLEMTAGSYNQIKVEGAAGGALSENVSGRFSFVRNKHDGYIDNRIGEDLNNGDDWAMRLQLLFDLGEKAEWLLSWRTGRQDIDSGFFEHSSARVNPDTGLGEHHDGPDLQDSGDSTASAYQESGNDVHQGSYNVIGYNKVKTGGVTSNLKFYFENFDLVSITDYWHLEKDYLEDSDASPNNFFAFFLQSDLEQFSQEVRLNGSTDAMRWVLGAYYLNIDGDFSNGGIAGNFFAAAFPGFGLGGWDTLGLYNPFSTKTESLAVFTQEEFDLTDTLTFIAGLRWSKERKEEDYKQYIADFAAFNSSEVVNRDALGVGGALWTFSPDRVSNDPGGVNFGFPLIEGDPRDAKIDKDLITAKIELDWTPSDSFLGYISYNRGIKAGGFNAPLDATLFYDGTRKPSDMQFDEEVLDAYEVGFKKTLADGKARINGSVYYYDYKDYQAFALDSLTTYVFNTDATVQGAELEIFASPTAGMDLLLGVSYIDNNVEDAYTKPNGESVDREAVMTPELTVNGLVRYEWAAFNGMVAGQLDFNYMDEHYFQLKNSPVGKEDAYTVFNARVSWESEKGDWGLAAFVNNLTDEEYRTMVFDLAGTPAEGGFGMAENYYGLPRWAGVSVKYRWGD